MAEDYDFIIVGAGSAGCALANGLSAAPANRVLLIESGPVDKGMRVADFILGGAAAPSRVAA